MCVWKISIMKVERIQIREIRIPLVEFFETSFGRTTERRIVLVKITCDGVHGWAECTAGEGPFYSYESTDTAWCILQDFLVPRLIGRTIGKASDSGLLFQSIRGHNMAKAALECALWDIEARQAGVPLAKLIGGELGEIPCGVSIGIDQSIEKLLEKVGREVEAGYQRIKVKIKPGWDIDILGAIRNRFPRIRLMADANAAYSLKDLPRLKILDHFHLMMIEQPLGWDDLMDHARLQKEIATPICLDEPITSLGKAREAVELGSAKIINIKLGRVGGYSEALRIHNFCQEKNVPVWCGGMLEAGVGRVHNIALSSLPNFVLPGDISASKRYWKQDIIEPEVSVTPQGTVMVPDGEGIGYSINTDRIESLTLRQKSFS